MGTRLESITQKIWVRHFERPLRTGRWKLIVRCHPRCELYDLQVDPGEHDDLFKDPSPGGPAKVKELAAMISNSGKRLADRIAVEPAPDFPAPPTKSSRKQL